MSTATAPQLNVGTDFKGYKPGAKLLAWAVDEKARVNVVEVEVVKILGDHLIVRPVVEGAEKGETMTFSRKAGTKAGNAGYPYIPNSTSRLLHPDEAGMKLLADCKAGRIKPILNEGDLALRKAVEWLRAADYQDVVKVVEIDKLARAAHEAGAI